MASSIQNHSHGMELGCFLLNNNNEVKNAESLSNDFKGNWNRQFEDNSNLSYREIFEKAVNKTLKKSQSEESIALYLKVRKENEQGPIYNLYLATVGKIQFIHKITGDACGSDYPYNKNRFPSLREVIPVTISDHHDLKIEESFFGPGNYALFVSARSMYK